MDSHFTLNDALIYVESFLDKKNDDLYLNMMYQECVVDTLLEDLNNSISSDNYMESVGIIKTNISKVCKAVKDFLSSIRDFINKGVEPIILKAKHAMNSSISKTEVKDEYSKTQKIIFNTLNMTLKHIKQFAVDVKNAHGWDRTKTIMIGISIPCPIPGATTGTILFTKAVDLLITYKNRVKENDIDAVVDELDKTVSHLGEIDPNMSSIGGKLLEKLKKLLSLAKSQISKLTSTVRSRLSGSVLE